MFQENIFGKNAPNDMILHRFYLIVRTPWSIIQPTSGFRYIGLQADYIRSMIVIRPVFRLIRERGCNHAQFWSRPAFQA